MSRRLSAQQNRRDQGSLPFDPTQLAGVRMWMDPNSGVVGGSPVTGWADKLGNVATFASVGTDLVAGTGINGRKTIDMNLGAGSSYLNAAAILSAFISASSWTLLVVFKYSGASLENASTFLNPGIIGSVGTYWHKTISTTKLDNVQYDGAYKNDQTAIANGIHYAIMRYDGVNVSTSLDGSAFDAGTASGNIAVIGDNPILIGANPQVTPTAFFVGSMGDIIAYNTSISNGDAVKLNAWAKARYGL